MKHPLSRAYSVVLFYHKSIITYINCCPFPFKVIFGVVGQCQCSHVIRVSLPLLNRPFSLFPCIDPSQGARSLNFRGGWCVSLVNSLINYVKIKLTWVLKHGLIDKATPHFTRDSYSIQNEGYRQQVRSLVTCTNIGASSGWVKKRANNIWWQDKGKTKNH